MISRLAAPYRAVDIGLDDKRHRLLFTLRGPVTGPEVCARLCELYIQQPELTGYDYVFDLREYSGDVEAAHLEPIAQIYAGVRVPEAESVRTAFVTLDPNFELWATAMDFQFPGREHRVFLSMAEAEAFLRPEPTAA